MKEKGIKYFKKAILWLENRDTKIESTVVSLAPKVLKKEEDIEIVQPYLDELERSLAEDDLTNIAITGAYGSGKSTIIKTFQYLHPEYDYLNISLASLKIMKKMARKTD